MLPIHVYSRDGCGICVRVKKKLGLYRVPFTEHKIGTDITSEELKAKFPVATQLPVVDCEWGYFYGIDADRMITEYKEDFGKELLVED